MICPVDKTHQSGDKCSLCGFVFKGKKKSEGIKQVSEKQKDINSGKKKQMKEFKKEREGICSGCGTPSLLTNSHLIPISQNKKLELDPLNQVWHCVDKCHPIWEHDKQGRKKMRDYSSNMQKIKTLCIEYYNLMVMKNGL